MGPERCVSTSPGGQTGAPSSSVIPSRPTGLPSSIDAAEPPPRYAIARRCARLRSKCRGPRRAAHDGDESGAVGDRLPVHRQQPIARAAVPRARRRCRRVPTATTRGGVPGGQIEAQTRQQFARFRQGAPILVDPQASRAARSPSRRTRSGITPSSRKPAKQGDLQLFGVVDIVYRRHERSHRRAAGPRRPPGCRAAPDRPPA